MSSIMATPAAKKMAAERRIDLAKVTGTGVGGYIQLSDVLTHKGSKATPLAKAYAAFYDVDIFDVTTDSDIVRKADVLEHKSKKRANTIPVSGIRAVIARRMQESLQTVPQYTNHATVCVYELKMFLAAYKEKSFKQGGIKPTYTDLLIKAAALALRDNMILNSSFGETHIVIHDDINIGIAVALEDGLIVPVIKNAGKKPLGEITADRKQLVDKARSGKLLPEEYTGGTFTISNMGGYPVEYFTPIINLPESAILGIGAITEQVVPINGNIAIRPMMGISLTSDHRHIDGTTSGAFIKRFKEIIEEPAYMEE